MLCEILDEGWMREDLGGYSIYIYCSDGAENAVCGRGEQAWHTPNGAFANYERRRAADEPVADLTGKPARYAALCRRCVNLDGRLNGYGDVELFAYDKPRAGKGN